MTEGAETLTVTARGKTASILVNDTSLTPTVITPPTTIVSSTLYGNGRYFIPTSGSDKVTGTAFLDVVRQPSNLADNQLTKLSDGTWQVQNKTAPSNSDNLVNIERIEFSDISVALDVSGSAGQVAGILVAVFGPSYLQNTTYAGIGLAYLDAGTSYSDLCQLAINAAGLNATTLVSSAYKNLFRRDPDISGLTYWTSAINSGLDYGSFLSTFLQSTEAQIFIKQTNLSETGLAYKPYVLPPTNNLSASTSSINEGSTALFTLRTTNDIVGTEVNYVISGVSPSDLTSGTLTGKVRIEAGGAATISVPIAADGSTEGQETLTISSQGATASIVINDTSKGNATPTYTLTPAALSVNEGELARVYVNTTNVAAGIALQYGVSGVNSTDLIGGLTRLVTVDSLGQAFINIQTIADQLTEGPETMYITLGTSISSLIINDTSVTLVGVIDNGGGDGGGGGGGGAGGGD
jgi:hypothetical protein